MIDGVIITKILQQTDKLILPGLGTLLKKADGDIMFSQFLRTDDMEFSSVIMNSYNVGADEAKQMVSELIAEIAASIENKGGYIIPKVGKLVKDPSGSIRLVKDFQPVVEPIVLQPAPQQRQQVTPKPIVGVPQQAEPTRYQQLRQQPPYGPNPQRPIPPRPTPQYHPQPQQPRPQQYHPQQRQQPRPQQRTMAPQVKAKKKDWILIVAIVVAVIVLILMIYSLISPTINDFM